MVTTWSWGSLINDIRNPCKTTWQIHNKRAIDPLVNMYSQLRVVLLVRLAVDARIVPIAPDSDPRGVHKRVADLNGLSGQLLGNTKIDYEHWTAWILTTTNKKQRPRRISWCHAVMESNIEYMRMSITIFVTTNVCSDRDVGLPLRAFVQSGCTSILTDQSSIDDRGTEVILLCTALSYVQRSDSVSET